MKYLILLVAIACPLLATSQKAPIKFGDIPAEALTMNKYAPDSSAEAVVLMDYGLSTIEYNQSAGFELIFERTRRIKILTEAGKQWADFAVNLYKDNDQSEKLSSFKGVTVNLENGKAVESKLSSDGIFKEKYSKNLERVKVTLPNVKVGSVIDISYKVKSEFLFNFQDWEFQTTIPVVWSEYRAKVPEYFIYDKYMQGYLPLSVNEQNIETGSLAYTSNNSADRTSAGGGTGNHTSPNAGRIEYKLNTFRWAASNAPAFRDEPFMTTRNDYISRMNFELAVIRMPGEPDKNVTGSWKEINELFAESTDFLAQVTGNGFLRKIAEEVTASATTPPQKIEAIVGYVKRNVAWNGESRIGVESNLKSVLDDQRGNSAEINLLIASMLEKVGVDVKPVLLSTRDHGFLRESTPAAQQFNYTVCLARWEDKRLLLDGTNPFLPVGYLPARCLNGQGMAVSKDTFEWIPLNAPAKSRSVVSSDLALSADGVLSGQVKLDYTGYKAAEKRQKYSKDGDAEYAKDLIGGRPWELTKSEYANHNNLSEAFKETHEVVINEHVSVAGDVMYLNPFVEGQWTSNPFKSEKREYPVDFGSAFDEVYMVKVKVPEGYSVDEMPAAKVMALPGNAAKYSFSTTVNNGMVVVTSMLSMNKSLFASDEYIALREFCNQLVAKQTEQIVIKKK